MAGVKKNTQVLIPIDLTLAPSALPVAAGAPGAAAGAPGAAAGAPGAAAGAPGAAAGAPGAAGAQEEAALCSPFAFISLQAVGGTSEQLAHLAGLLTPARLGGSYVGCTSFIGGCTHVVVYQATGETPTTSLPLAHT
jgi:hypothetical protein